MYELILCTNNEVTKYFQGYFSLLVVLMSILLTWYLLQYSWYMAVTECKVIPKIMKVTYYSCTWNNSRWLKGCHCAKWKLLVHWSNPKENKGEACRGPVGKLDTISWWQLWSVGWHNWDIKRRYLLLRAP